MKTAPNDGDVQLDQRFRAVSEPRLLKTTTGLYILRSPTDYHKDLRNIPDTLALGSALELFNPSLLTPLASYVDFMLSSAYNTLLGSYARKKRLRDVLGDAALYTAETAERMAWMAMMPWLSLRCNPTIAEQAHAILAFWVACTHLDDLYDQKDYRNNKVTARKKFGESAALHTVEVASDRAQIMKLSGGDRDFAALWSMDFSKVMAAEKRKIALGGAAFRRGVIPSLQEYRSIVTERLSFFGDFFASLAEMSSDQPLQKFFKTCYPWFAWLSQIRNDLKNHGLTDAGREYDDSGYPIYHGESGELFSDITDGRATFSTIIFFEQGSKHDKQWVLEHVWDIKRPLSLQEYRYVLDIFVQSGVLEAILHTAAQTDDTVESLLLAADLPDEARDLWYGWYFRMLKTFISANYKDPNPNRMRRFRQSMEYLSRDALVMIPSLHLAS